MAAPLDIATINIVAAYAGLRVLPHYVRWLLRDGKRLSHMYAGLLVIAMTALLLLVTYEAGYYAVARLARHMGDIDMWGKPWTFLVFITRTLCVVGLLVAYAAKLRADGMCRTDTAARTGWLMLECLVVGAVIAFML